MKKILVLGAGLSTHVLIKYLLDNSEENDWFVTVGDLSLEIAKKSINNHNRGEAIKFDIFDENQAEKLIKETDMVVSMLPARFHHIPAEFCIKFGKNLVTASYVSEQLQALDAQAKEKGLIFLNEVGLDPGIDHMSTMKVLKKLKAQGATVTGFRSFTGGLVAPKYDNNPWHYKFTWNPRNVVMAGQGTAQFIVNGKYKYIPYHKLFERVDRINVLNYGEFEGYANRDSLKYRSAYGLDNVQTMIRGTLRRTGYAKTWNIFVQLGMTDDTYFVENSEKMTYREFINSYLKYDPVKSVENKLAEYLNIPPDSYCIYRLRWLGIFDDRPIGLKKATPAQILQQLLEEKWVFEKEDRDMIVMQHVFEYTTKENKKKKMTSSFVIEGEEDTSAMAITVGTPAAIAVKLIMQGKIKVTGVKIPTLPEIYEPILDELETIGVRFIEEESDN
ncbi:MAG: saccharopine dehydrogenase NADP-binding domain-containing protein [Bacteroidales bacterium]|nr:saccharopine dehydrogenase NADP-binding domain-containing protein [Bacteroidales bacterium]